MADPKTCWFRYEGPPVYSPALGVDVTDGDELQGPDLLESNFGFTKIGKPPKSKSHGGDDN